MKYEYIGIVEGVEPVQTFKSGFKKRTLVVGEDVGSNTKYPAHNPFDFKGDYVAKLDNIHPGMRVKVQFVLDGRKWEDGKGGVRHFASCTGLGLETMAKEGDVVADTSASYAPKPAMPPADFADEGLADDLPF